MCPADTIPSMYALLPPPSPGLLPRRRVETSPWIHEKRQGNRPLPRSSTGELNTAGAVERSPALHARIQNDPRARLRLQRDARDEERTARPSRRLIASVHGDAVAHRERRDARTRVHGRSAAGRPSTRHTFVACSRCAAAKSMATCSFAKGETPPVADARDAIRPAASLPPTPPRPAAFPRPPVSLPALDAGPASLTLPPAGGAGPWSLPLHAAKTRASCNAIVRASGSPAWTA